MSLWAHLFKKGGTAGQASIRSAVGDTGFIINTTAELEQAIRAGAVTISGHSVTAKTSLGVAAVFASNRIISGAVGNMPIDVKIRVDDKTREDAIGSHLWKLLRRRPNRWMKPSQFKRLLTSWVLLRGNAYALKVRNFRGEVVELLPMHPDRVEVKQSDNHELLFIYTSKKGVRKTFKQADVFHLFNFSLDGVVGVTPITFAREAIGGSMAMDHHGATVFKNGARVAGAFKINKSLSPDAYDRLKASIDDYRAGGAKEGMDILLEEGMEYSPLAMTIEDAKWVESKKMNRTEIFMFFGIPPHMAGDVEKSSNWGTGLEEQRDGFNAYVLEDYLTMWEEAITVDLADNDLKLYVRFQRNALVRANLKIRTEHYVQMVQFGIMSPNEVRAKEDMNPRDGGDIFYPPPNMSANDKPDEESDYELK